MNRFLTKLMVFLSPVLAGCVYLYFVPQNKQFAYCLVEGPCGTRATWLYRRVVAPSAPIDLAFLGTSRTMSGVDDRLIESTLHSHGIRIRVANLGYCRGGLNFQYVQLKELLAAKVIGHVVLEVGFGQAIRSHPEFGYVADPEDLLRVPIWSNKHFIGDLFKNLLARFEQHRGQLLSSASDAPTSSVPLSPLETHGYNRFVGVEQPKTLEQAKRSRAARSGVRKDTMHAFPKHYLDAMVQMTQKRGIQIHFLYLPRFGFPWGEIGGAETYRQYAEILVPPREIFHDLNNWLDVDHLNVRGATLLSAWLADQIARWPPPKG